MVSGIKLDGWVGHHWHLSGTRKDLRVLQSINDGIRSGEDPIACSLSALVHRVSTAYLVEFSEGLGRCTSRWRPNRFEAGDLPLVLLVLVALAGLKCGAHYTLLLSNRSNMLQMKLRMVA